MKMTTQDARLFAGLLIKAADQADAEGRNTLLESDIAFFAAADDDARAELLAAINRKTEEPNS